MMQKMAVVLLSLLVLVAVACDPVSDEELTGPPTDRIQVLWNPGQAVMPTPTDLVRDEGLESLDIPVDEEDTEAQQGFTAYLNSLDGYPLSTPIRIPVTAAINENSLGRGLVVARADTGESVPVDAYYDDQRREIVVQARQALRPGEEYVVIARGYQHGLVGQDGEMVVADAPFFLVRSPNSLRDYPQAMPGDTKAERRQMAEEMAQIQDRLERAFEIANQRDIPRAQIAVAATFTTTSKPAIRFDSARGDMPFPNDLLVDPDDHGIDLPIDDDMSAEEQTLRHHLSGLDGFSMSAAMTVDSTHDFGDVEPTAEGLRLFERRDDGAWVEVDDVERGRLDEQPTLWMRPELTLEPETTYALLVTDAVTARSGERHRAQPQAAMLMLDAPLVDADGQSQLRTISDRQAQRLEPVRERADELLRQLEQAEGLERDRLAATVPFRTASSASSLLARRADLYEREVSTAVSDIEVTMPSGAAGLLLNNVESVIRGTMPILDYLDPTTRAWRDDGEPQMGEAKFVLTLPEDVAVDEPIPVVLFGHGLMTSRELVYLIASELASAGYAAFAMDLPYHGDRAVCIEDTWCEGDASCDDDGQCRGADGSPADVREIEAMSVLPVLEGTQYDELLNYPMNSGLVFIDMDNIPGTADHFSQALLDLNQAVRVIRGPELDDTVVEQTGLWLGDEIVYLGMSLGGILGSGLTAVEPEIETFVLNVGAADLTRLIEHSVVFESVFEHALEEREIERDTDDYFAFMNATRWVFDPIDPLNLVQHAVDDPLTYEEPDTGQLMGERQARVMLQMAEGDMVVPNIGTQVLSQRMGVEYIEYRPTLTDHAFLFDPTMLDGATRDARQDMIEFFDAR